jgi:ParB/RepB/Spo0J family partition protein
MTNTVSDSTESATLRQVDPARVVPHPANPRKDLGDLAELQASIAEQGVLQPVVLLPADRVAAAWPQHAEQLAGAELVVLMGHRRHAASLAVRDSARATMPALIRVDAIADDPLAQLDAMTAENVARKALTPVEEARAYAEQAAAGRGQRQIAARAGCSQSHVSKRLKLLKLPAQMLRDVEAGKLDVGDALVYVDKAGGDQFVMLTAYTLGKQRDWWRPEQLVDEVRREQARQAEADALTKKAAQQGLTVIEDPRKTFGYEYWSHRLEGKKAIARARKDGTLVAHIRPQGGGLDYYSTTRPKKTENRSAADEQRLVDERERRRATTARAEHTAALAARPPKLPPAAADIVDAWLWAPGNDLATLAGKWLTAAGVGPDPDLPPHQWWQQIRTADWPTRVHAAHALAIARHEIRARTTYRKWTHEDAAWLARLAEHTGYTPTAWEQARLAAVDAAPASREYRLLYDPADSAWLLLDADRPIADHDGLEQDDVETAKCWAAEVLIDTPAGEGLGAVEWTTRDLGGPVEYVAATPTTATPGSPAHP